jgi:hypothetical protein
MLSSLRFLGMVALSVLALEPTRARAQEPGPCHVPAVGSLQCGLVPCSVDDECLGFAPDGVCVAVDPAGGELHCTATCGTLASCSDGGCPEHAGAVGACTPMATPIGAVRAVCEYPTLGITHCPSTSGAMGTVVSNPVLFDCYTVASSLGTGVTDNWFKGDCDRDGCPNGADADPCDASGAECFGTVIGDVCGPMPPPDAGIVGVADAGAPEVDAGGAGEIDSGTEVPPGTMFSGGGGCRCAVAASRAPAGGALAIAAIALGALARRRRS